MERQYPDTKTAECLIIVADRSPPGPVRLTLLGMGCVLGLGLMGGIWFVGRWLATVPDRTARTGEPDEADGWDEPPLVRDRPAGLADPLPVARRAAPADPRPVARAKRVRPDQPPDPNRPA